MCRGSEISVNASETCKYDRPLLLSQPVHLSNWNTKMCMIWVVLVRTCCNSNSVKFFIFSGQMMGFPVFSLQHFLFQSDLSGCDAKERSDRSKQHMSCCVTMQSPSSRHWCSHQTYFTRSMGSVIRRLFLIMSVADLPLTGIMCVFSVVCYHELRLRTAGAWLVQWHTLSHPG